MQTTIYNMSDREIEASRCGESETKMRMRVRKWAKYREQNIYRQSIQGNGRNILSSVASIFSLFSIYIYSIFDLFRLVYIVEMCVCVCCMWAAVFGIVFDVSANKFYHLFYSLLPIEYDMALSSGSSATQHGQTRHINTIQSTPYTLIGLESNSLTHTHAHPTTIYTLLSSAVNSYCLFCEFRSLIMCSLVWMAKWRT